ncbi:MAG: YdeI/OmpD-associated family protein, partial [Sediminibacterium sp.]|nr:YdeI/OmpD-associated family protein [Sediminibacterium sp.]
PCYTYQQNNIIILHAFKNYCALGFFKGALLIDEQNLLVKPGENTQAGRQMRFTNLVDIKKMKSVIKAYIYEAIEIEKSGIQMPIKKNNPQDIPIELLNKFKENVNLEKAFKLLTPGRQRAYLMHFSAAKQAKTIIQRIENYIPNILCGKGMNDCTCGLSKRLPNCDGSHKILLQKK